MRGRPTALVEEDLLSAMADASPVWADIVAGKGAAVLNTKVSFSSVRTPW